MTFCGGTLNKESAISWPEPVKNTELKLLWFASIALVLYFLFTGHSPRISDIILQSIFSLILSVSIIHLAGYRLFSLCTGFALTIIIFYPVCAMLNIALPSPAVRPDLWLHTKSALQACNIGLCGFLFGQFVSTVLLNSVFSNNLDRSSEKPKYMPPRWFFLLLTLTIACAALLKIKLGVFYHITILKPNPASNVFLNALETISWIGVTGICGFLIYSTSSIQKGRDLFCAACLIGAVTLIYLPSGSRMQAVGYLPITALLYLAYEKRMRRRLLVVFVAPVAIVAFIGILGFYRVSGADSHTSLVKKASIMYDALTNHVSDESSFEGAKLVVHRLSDYVATGRLVDWTPRVFPYRTFEGMDRWWQIYLPGALRPGGRDALNFNEGTLVTLKYRVSDGPWTSTPITLFGDVFSRFGWLGLFGVLAGFGFVYRFMDYQLRHRRSLFTLLIFVMYFRFLWQMYVSSFLNAFVSIMRDLPLILIIALVINMIYKTLMRKQVSHG